jgi:NAD(P)-dependent dehydrogenase (short-subunit alcohol dehydrogenase family)
MPPPQGKFNPIEAAGDYDCTKTVHNDTYPEIDSAKANLSGKAVLIVGGSKGIGRGIATSFAKAGVSHLAVTARSFPDGLEKALTEAAEAAGKKAPKVHLIKVEVTKLDSVRAAREVVETEIGRLDVLVNNAGILPEMKPLADTDPDLWWSTFDVNLKGLYYACHTFIPLLLKSPDGLKTIINVASVGAIVLTPGGNSYQLSKAAVLRLSEFIAVEYKDQGLICTAIHPGNVLTDILGPNGPRPEIAHVFTETVELAGDSIVWMAGGQGERKAWISGRYLTVCWDLPELDAIKTRIVEKDLLKPKLLYPKFGTEEIGF